MELVDLKKSGKKKLNNSTDPYSEPSNPSYSYDRLNENTDSNTTVVLPPHFDNSILPQGKMLQMALWVKMMYHQLDYIK